MSKHRKWVAQWSMGYCGTDEYEEIDLIDDWGWSEEQVEETTDEEIQAELDEYAWEQAIEKVSAYAKPLEEEEGD